MKHLLYLIAAFGLFCSSLSHAVLLNIMPESVDAAAWTVIDSHTGQVIAAHEADTQRAPASLTKMMVAYIALKEIQAGKLDKNEILTATPVVQNVMWDESQMYLKEGEQISVDQLLAGLIVMSANDAALTLAEKISGGVPQFIERMNQEAQALGMTKSHFQNPAGVTMPEHYSTASDLAKLSLALVNQTPDYLHYSKQTSFVYKQHFHRATNLLLKIDPSVDGLKTGFTRAAGYNLAASANRPTTNAQLPQRRLIAVVLGAKNGLQRAEIAHHLMNISYQYTQNEIAIPKNSVLADIPISQSTQKQFKLTTQQPTVITTSLYPSTSAIDLNHFDPITQRIAIDWGNGMHQMIEPLQQTQTSIKFALKAKQLTAPLDREMSLASVQIYQNDQLLRQIDIKQQINLVEATWLEKILMWLKNLLPFWSSEQATLKTYPIG